MNLLSKAATGGRSQKFSPLDLAAQALRALTTGPGPLMLADLPVDPGGRHGRESLPLNEVAALLLEPDLPCTVRDQVWRALALRARSEDPAWVVGAAGVAAPRLARITEHLAAGRAADRADIEAVVLAAFVHAVRTVTLTEAHLERRLLWAAFRAGAGRTYAGEPFAHLDRTDPWLRAVVPDATCLTDLFT